MSSKPRLLKVKGRWICHCVSQYASGETMAEAYRLWRERRILAAELAVSNCWVSA